MIDVIIPVYKPDEKFARLIKSLANQNRKPDTVIVMQTVEYADGYEWKTLSDEIRSILDLEGAKDVNLEVHPVNKNDFFHGRTRNRGAAYGHNPYMLFMTQDAIPYDEKLLERLMDVLEMKPEVSQAYARQVTDANAPDYIKYTQLFNYPSESIIKTKDTYAELGIKNIFCSNVCCMYRRDIFNFLGGFEDRVIFNEDMIYARKAIDAGYTVVYEADAKVVHYHKYTIKQQFKRNFDIGASQKMNREAFEGLSSPAEGGKLVKSIMAALIKKKEFASAFYYFTASAFKYIGYVLGKNYKHIPYGLKRKFSANPSFWSEG